MLSSCANPSCANKFRYLHQGKLFLLRSNDNRRITSARLDFAGSVDHLHYAWLCDQCSHEFEVLLDAENNDVKVRARYDLSGLVPLVMSIFAMKLAPAVAFLSDMTEMLA